MKKTVLALGAMAPEEMAALGRLFNVIELHKERDPEAAIRENARDIVGIMTVIQPVRENLIAALPNLEIIACFSVGFDHVDLESARARGIAVTNTPDVLTADTADIAVCLVLNLARRICEADMFVRVGKWQSGKAMPTGTALAGKRAGIVGLGRIGQAIATRLRAFEMDIVYHGRGAKPDQPYEYYDDLESMAQDCDFLILSCAGGAETQDMVDLTILQALGPKGFLVNIARGSVVNEGDLLIALRNLDIAGAGLDVYAHEPKVPEALLTMDNVVLLPHIGSDTLETRAKMGQLVIENLRAHFEGKPLLTPVMT